MDKFAWSSEIILINALILFFNIGVLYFTFAGVCFVSEYENLKVLGYPGRITTTELIPFETHLKKEDLSR